MLVQTKHSQIQLTTCSSTKNIYRRKPQLRRRLYLAKWFSSFFAAHCILYKRPARIQTGVQVVRHRTLPTEHLGRGRQTLQVQLQTKPQFETCDLVFNCLQLSKGRLLFVLPSVQHTFRVPLKQSCQLQLEFGCHESSNHQGTQPKLFVKDIYRALCNIVPQLCMKLHQSIARSHVSLSK